MNGANTTEQLERFDLMRINTGYIIRYLRDLYGGKVNCRRNALVITVDDEEFSVNLLDRTVKGNYVFHHTNSGNCFEDRNLAHGIFLAWNYKMYCDYGIALEEEDWHRFINDAYKYMGEDNVDIESLCETSI